MTESKFHSTRRGVHRVLSACGAPPPVKAIPVAFPIRKVVYRVTERQPLEIGLVERYLVEAVGRFGPLTTDGIAGLLGLDATLVRRVVDSLAGENAALQWTGDTVAAAPARDLPPHQQITHDRAFVVSALGGMLLPADAVHQLDTNRILADSRRDRYRTMEGEDVDLKGGFAPHPHHDGHDELLSLVDADPERCRRFGLPLALVDLGERQRGQEEDFWVEAVLLVGDRCRIRPVAVPGLDLVSPPHDTPEFAGRASMGSVGRLIESPVSVQWLEANVVRSLPKARLVSGDRQSQVVLLHPEGSVPLAKVMADAGGRWVVSLFEDGACWDRQSCSVAAVTMGDEPTAKAAAALRLRRRLAQDASSATDDPAGTWASVVESVRAAAAPGFAVPGLEFAEAVATLRRIDDSRLQCDLDSLEDAIGWQR